jgi:hypothetical protein
VQITKSKIGQRSEKTLLREGQSLRKKGNADHSTRKNNNRTKCFDLEDKNSATRRVEIKANRD